MTASDARGLFVPTGLATFHVRDGGPVGAPAALLWPSLFSDGQTTWGAQLSGMHRLGWRTLLVDPPGTGRTEAVSRLFTMEECAQAAEQILDAAGVDEAAVIGMSWGGYVALRLALSAPHRVSALVLSNTGARGVPVARQLRNRLFAWLIQSGLIPGGPGRLAVPQLISRHSRDENPSLARELIDTINGLDASGLAWAVRSVLVEPTSVVDRLHLVGVPALVITGAEDTGLPPSYSAELAQRIPDARLRVLPRVGHMSPREAPTAVADLIREFLAPLNPSGAQPGPDNDKTKD